RHRKNSRVTVFISGRDDLALGAIRSLHSAMNRSASASARYESSPQILLFLTPHRFASRVLALEPVGRPATGVVGRLPFCCYVVQPHLAGVGEHGRTIGLDVIVEPQARSGTPQYRCQRGLPCIERLTPQVVTVQLDEIEGVQEHASVVPPVADAVEA